MSVREKRREFGALTKLGWCEWRDWAFVVVPSPREGRIFGDSNVNFPILLGPKIIFNAPQGGACLWC
jgi:hypothetical protein